MSASSSTLVLAAVLLSIAACGGPRTEAPRRHVVEIRTFEYEPASLEMAPGDTIVWVNRDAVPHTATSASRSWDSGSIPAGGSWTLVASPDDVGDYACTFHSGMTGSLTAAAATR